MTFLTKISLSPAYRLLTACFLHPSIQTHYDGPEYEYITYLLMKKENIFRALIKNKSGIISKLDDLEKCGKKSLFVCVHLLLQEGDVSKI